jgi:predicted site-specific integrase-resolvase
MDETTEPALVRRIDAAPLLGISLATFDRWVRSGVLPRAETDRPGVWVAKEHIDQMIMRHGAANSAAQ